MRFPGAVDDDLLRRCRRGDGTALTALIARHQDRLYRLACRVLRDPARAEDAVADAFATVWARCGSWRGDAAAATWIYRVAYRVVLDHARARRRYGDGVGAGGAVIARLPASTHILAA